MGRLCLTTFFLCLATFLNETYTYVLPDDFTGYASLSEFSTISPYSSTAQPTQSSAVSLYVQNEPLQPETSTGTSGKVKKYACDPAEIYTKMDTMYCDRYVTCSYGHSYFFECPDGYGYVPRQGCKLLHQVECGSRIKLQPPKGSGSCTRLNGIYPSRTDCAHYVRCTNGTAVAEQCTGQSIFDDLIKACRDPTLQEYAACFVQQQTLVTFTPPVNQQTPPIYSSVGNEPILPPTYRPPINEQSPTSYKPFANQQALVTDYDSIANQVPMTFNPQANQPIQTTYVPLTPTTPTYNPLLYGNQQITSPYNPSAHDDIQTPIYDTTAVNNPVSQYGQTITYELTETGVAPAITNEFVCPPSTYFAFGDHNRYQYPGNCHLFYVCLRDGGIKIGGCQAPVAYKPKTQVCGAMQYVPNSALARKNILSSRAR